MPPENPSLTHVLGLILRHGQPLLVYPSAFGEYRPPSIRTPAQIGIPYIAPLLRTKDAVRLNCYLLPQSTSSLASPRSSHISTNHSSRRRRSSPAIDDERVELTPAAADADATVLVFHGNAAHNWEDMESAEDFFKMGCNVLLASYRGYSLSDGAPTEGGLRIDAQTALDYVLNDPYLSKTPIIIYGHSLGGAVATDLASRNPTKISALVLSNTFTSIPDIVRDWPLIGPFSFLCTQRWNSASKIRRVPLTTPILMLSGRLDEVVPAKLMDRLWAAAKARDGGGGGGLGGWGVVGCASWCTGKDREKEDKEEGPVGDVFVRFDSGGHCDTPNSRSYWDAVASFVEQVRKTTSVALPSPPPPDERKTPDVRWRYEEGKMVVIT